MSKRSLLAAVATILFVVVSAVVLLELQSSRKKDQPHVNDPPVVAPSATNTPDSGDAGTQTRSSPPSVQTKRDNIQTVLQLLNHKSIEFYGRVLDQDNHPVPDVHVYAAVIYNTGAAGGTAQKQTKTDAAGNFSISDMVGRTLDVGLAKEGYRYGNDSEGFQYTELVAEAERHHPDKNNPVVFHIWKLQGPEPLMKGNKVFRVPNDGSPLRIDLHTGKVVSGGGDVVVHLQVEPTKTGPFGWKMELEAPSGGLIETTQQITAMFAAPDADYEPSIKIQMDPNSAGWRQGVTQNLYLKTAGDNYGKLSVNIGTNRADPYGVMTLRWWLNPKVASRILEPTKTEQILGR